MAAKMSSQRKAWKIKTLLERYGNACWLCGKNLAEGVDRMHPKAPTLDHVVPVSEGGTNADSNLRLAHRRCNGKRADGFPEVVTFSD